MEINPDPYRGPVTYGFEVNSGEGVATEVWLNGIKISASPAGEMGIESLAIHHDVIPTNNRAELRITVAALGESAAAIVLPGPMPDHSFAQLMLQGDQSEVSGDQLNVTTHPLARVRFAPAEGAPSLPCTLPMTLPLTFDALHAPPPPLWMQGAPSSGNEIANLVYGEMESLARSLRAGDIQPFLNATASRRRRMAQCYPLGPNSEQRAEKEADELSRLAATAGFQVKLLAPGQATFRTQANGRLFDWVDAKGDSAMTISTANLPPTPVNMQFSMIDGRALIVR